MEELHHYYSLQINVVILLFHHHGSKVNAQNDIQDEGSHTTRMHVDVLRSSLSASSLIDRLA